MALSPCILLTVSEGRTSMTAFKNILRLFLQFDVVDR